MSLQPFLSAADGTVWSIRWSAPGSSGALPALAALAAAALWFLWTSLSRLPSRLRKSAIVALRVAVFALLFAALLRPELEFRKISAAKNSIAVLFDDSRSMSIKTMPGQQPRIDLVKAAVEKHRADFDRLRRDYLVDYYFVSGGITPATQEDIANGSGPSAKYRAHAPNTDLNKVLLDVRKRYEGRSLRGALLFSDGGDLAQTPPAADRPPETTPELLDTLARFGVPVHTFQAGTNAQFKDLAIENVEMADFGFVQQPFNLAVTLAATDMGDRRIPLVLKEDDKILLTKIVEIKSGQTRYKADLEFTPVTVGNHIYTLTVPLYEGEAIESNNRRDFLVKVARDRFRILLLNGRPSWDARFLREVLTNNPKVDLLSFFILRTANSDVESSTEELSLIPFPSNLLFSDYLSSFDLVILQNFQYEPYIEARYLSNIRDYVQKGGALIMVGGDLAFRGGGYQGTPVEEVLPVTINDAPQADGPLPVAILDEFRPRLESRLINHPILRLEQDGAANLAAWKSLPALQGVNAGLAAAKDAHVLMSYTRQGESFPVLAVRREGAGRSLILATDTSWYWNFRHVGEGGSGRYYEKFWNNVIAWSAAEPETLTAHIETDKEKYRPEETAVVRFKVLQEDYNPLAKAKVALTVTLASGKKPVSSQTLVTDTNGEGEYRFLPEEEGVYTARLEVAGKEKRTVETRFGVFGDTAEFQKPLVNDALLKTIAKVTGGVYQVLDEKTDMSRLRFAATAVSGAVTKTVPLWDNWGFYGLILALLGVDWWSRRKSGLS